MQSFQNKLSEREIAEAWAKIIFSDWLITQNLIVKHQENKLSELKAFKSSLLDTAFKGEL